MHCMHMAPNKTLHPGVLHQGPMKPAGGLIHHLLKSLFSLTWVSIEAEPRVQAPDYSDVSRRTPVLGDAFVFTLDLLLFLLVMACQAHA